VKSDKALMKPQRNLQWAMQHLLALHAGCLRDQADHRDETAPAQDFAITSYKSKELSDQLYLVMQLLYTSYSQINDSRVHAIKEAMIKNPLFSKLVSNLVTFIH